MVKIIKGGHSFMKKFLVLGIAVTLFLAFPISSIAIDDNTPDAPPPYTHG